MSRLYETYENCKSEVGKKREDSKPPLLPISHTIISAKIEVTIDSEGNFITANCINKSDAVTIAPCTEDSMSRSSGNAPHILFDKLQYVAGDYCTFFKDKRGKKFFEKYINQLESWCNSEYKYEKAAVILKYLKKESLVSDLVKKGLLKMGDDNQITNKWFGDKENKPQKVSDSFIRFIVYDKDDLNCKTWEDPALFDKYSKYYLSTKSKSRLCYVTGKSLLIADKHQSSIRGDADKAKLISGNDSNGFTYNGHFHDKEEMVSIAHETSQKAHNALKWLVDIQGIKFGNPTDGQKVILAWGTKNEKIPDFINDTLSALLGDPDNQDTYAISTEKEFAKRLSKAIASYRYDLNTKSQISIIALDSATTGRLSVTYYRETDGKDFLDRIEGWHRTCRWRHQYRRKQEESDIQEKNKRQFFDFVGAPSLRDIATVSFGVPRTSSNTNMKKLEISDSLIKSTIERLLPCVIEGAKLPYDIVSSAVNRASSPVSMEKWERQKALSIACALVRKYRSDRFKEVWDMALDENQKDRSYLFGRLLAVAQQIEEWALDTMGEGEKRETNAERLMHQFKIHPYKTWGILTDKLRPYIARLGKKADRLVELMTQVNSLISYEDFTSRKTLEDSYILGYYCQRQVFIEEKKKRIEESIKNKLNNKSANENDN